MIAGMLPLNLIDSALLIKSFAHNGYENRQQLILNQELRVAQLEMRKTNFLFDGLKTFIKQVSVLSILDITT